MKTIFATILFIFIAVFSWSDDWETYELMDRLLTLSGPGAPEIFENSVIFTASSNLRTVGVAFAHENFSQVYWFRRLLLSQDRLTAVIPTGQLEPPPYRDSGIQFYVYQVPDNIRELEYRLVINGLWIADPANSNTRRDPVTGLNWSVLSLPQKTPRHNPLDGLPQGLNFSFNGPPGEIVTVAGDFNGWDPFMFEMKEGPAGVYTLNIPLPSGTYQYVFFHRGIRYSDPHNSRRVYSRNGGIASEIVVP